MVFYYGYHLIGVDWNGLTSSKGKKPETYLRTTPDKTLVGHFTIVLVDSLSENIMPFNNHWTIEGFFIDVAPLAHP